MKREEIFNSHIENFKKLSPIERIVFSLSFGYFFYNLLDEDKKKIYQSFRNGGKYVRRRNKENL